MLKATSTAPPPATTFPDSKVLLATQIESCNDLVYNINLPLNFVKHVFISTSQDDGTGIGLLAALKEDEIVIPDGFFINFLTFTQI